MEIRNLFVRSNILKRMFHKCTLAVKLTLFKCKIPTMCSYDIGFWSKYTAALANSCYYKCIKAFFGYKRFDSV